MLINTTRKVIANFGTNGATWTAPQDGLVWILANQAVSGIAYVYFSDNSGSILAAISLTAGTGGLTYTAFAVVTKGITYKLGLSGYTSCGVYWCALKSYWNYTVKLKDYTPIL